MNTTEITERYMEQYDGLVNKFKEYDINNLVDELNGAIDQADMNKINALYNKVLEWNAKVENLAGAKRALDIQFRYLHLPSPSIFSVIYDGEERVWKFNTAAE